MSMTAISLSLVCGSLFGLFAFCLLTHYRCRAFTTAATQTAQAQTAEAQRRIDALAAEIHELRQENPSPAAAGIRPSLNFTTRSQALRLHRRGDAPELIAAALNVPRQEVELLVKVHQIVMSRV